MDSNKKKKSKRDKERGNKDDGLKKMGGGVKYDTVVDRQVLTVS